MTTAREPVEVLRVARERAEQYVEKHEKQLVTTGAAVSPAKRLELVLASMRAIGITTKTCPECGYPLLKTRRFCVTCGTDELARWEIDARLGDGAPSDVERIAAFVERRAQAYPEDVFLPGGSSRDAIAADTLRKMLPQIAVEIREERWRDEP
jgi:hypothetical protein